ncbi:MAG TPA: lysylphosphatidylglycerol synthase transmembrane domain-containing protein [Terriglobales bacterium]|nr:lysylphosphatidylglycerol synthase transmembrane domain-containing protein [Terriglobales bacterium]
MSQKRILTTAIVLAILGVLVYFQVQHWRSFDWARFRTASRVNPLHIAAAIALIYLTYVLRALRWKVFLEPVCEASTWNIVPPTFIGFTGLALLGRPGEFIRPYLISRKENLSFASQVGVWTVERIFDVGAFTVLMTVDVFFSSAIRVNPYLHKFKIASVLLCFVVALGSLIAFLVRIRGNQVAQLVHKLTAKFSKRLAHAADQRVRAFGEGLNTISGAKSLLKLIAISLLTWFLIAVAYREVAHSYPHETLEQGPPAVDVETADLANLPEAAGQPLTDDIVGSLNDGLQSRGYVLRIVNGDVWLFRQHKRIKKVGDRPHLANMDVPHVLLLMGFSMIGSVVQLPAVGGGSQLAVISALQVIYGIPPELALSCGILLWLVTFMSCIPVGLAFAHQGHLSLRKLSKASHENGAKRSALGKPPTATSRQDKSQLQ